MKEHFDNKFIDDIDEQVGGNYFSPVLSHVLPQVKADIICDIGCGNGVFTADIKQKIDCRLIGIDSNSYALNQASRLGFDELVQIDDFCHDTLPIESCSIDFAICKDVLEHLIDPLFLTKEISRILKPGGLLLLHVPNHFPIWGRLKFLLTNNIDTFSYFPGCSRSDFPHIRFFTLSSINNLLKDSDFELTENLSFFFVQPRLVHRIMPKWFKKILAEISTDNFSEGITILATKK